MRTEFGLLKLSLATLAMTAVAASVLIDGGDTLFAGADIAMKNAILWMERVVSFF